MPRLMNPHLTKHLVHDEMIALDHRGTTHTFNVRVWCARDAAPIVLVTWPSEFGKLCPIPFWATTRLANIVHSDILRYPAQGMVFMELHEDQHGNMEPMHCVFDYVGCIERLRHTKPAKFPITLSTLSVLIGGPISV